MKRKDKIAAGMVKPQFSKYELRKIRRINPDSPFAVLLGEPIGEAERRKDKEQANDR